MTFSVVGRVGTALGVAVASRFLAVGAAVPAAAAGVGALATQAQANLAYGPQGLALLRHGASAAGTVAGLIAADDGRDGRQLGVLAATGPGATYTGAGCHDWAGGAAGEDHAIQGNILTGPEVVAAMAAAWRGGPDGVRPGGQASGELARRLLTTLAAGDAAGGDRRGRQSAALLVVAPGAGYGGTSDVAIDLRVDDHPDPVTELGRLLVLHDLYFGRADPAELLPLTGPLAAEVDAAVAALGHDALDGWAGVENLEERLVDGAIDPLVLARLRAAAALPSLPSLP